MVLEVTLYIGLHWMEIGVTYGDDDDDDNEDNDDDEIE